MFRLKEKYSEQTDVMTKTNHNEARIIQVLEEKFGAETIKDYPDNEASKFLKQRYELENIVWTIDQYFRHYHLLKTFGLEEKLIDELQWNIIWQLENNKPDFLESDFYKKFKDHNSVQRAKTEYNQRDSLNYG